MIIIESVLKIKYGNLSSGPPIGWVTMRNNLISLNFLINKIIIWLSPLYPTEFQYSVTYFDHFQRQNSRLADIHIRHFLLQFFLQFYNEDISFIQLSAVWTEDKANNSNTQNYIYSALLCTLAYRICLIIRRTHNLDMII